MSIKASHLRDHVIKPTLDHLNMWSQSAENLLLGIAAQESHMGTFLKQLGSGPALGIYQMEPATEKDIWDNFLKYRPSLMVRVVDLAPSVLNAVGSSLIMSLSYATAMARIHLYRDSEPLPNAYDVQGMAAYWKRVYNTHLGAGTEEEFIANYSNYILSEL